MKFVWNQKSSEEVLDLRKIYNFYSIDSFSKLSEFINSSHKDEYEFYFNKIKTILSSWKRYPCGSAKEIEEMVPRKFLERFTICRNQIVEEGCQWLKAKPYYDDLISFFKNEKSINVVDDLNFKIKTLRGIEEVNLEYAQNFRFKVKSGLNIFNCLPKERSIIIPQENDEFIYSVDFKQFEFRSYLKLINFDIDFNNLDLYNTFSENYKINGKNSKIEIISYLYGKKNEELDKILNKDEVLNKIENELFKFQDKIVVIDERKEKYKLIHTINQTISQYYLLEKLQNILKYLEGKKSTFLYPIHDEFVFSVDRKEAKEVMKNIKEIMVDDVYKVSEYVGNNLYEKREWN